MVRPEALALHASQAEMALAGIVVERQFTGPTELYQVRLDNGGETLVSVPARGEASHEVGSRVWVAPVAEGRVRAFPGAP